MSASSKLPKSVVTRPAALIVESDASFRDALREASQGQDVLEALRQVLLARGYDVVVTACLDEAKRLMRQRSFDRIYSDGPLPVNQVQSDVQAPTGPRVEDRGDGTARVQIDQVLPWSLAVELMDLLSDSGPDKPRRLS